jgi:mannose-6-phosphate isomerase-like protein (cupin superfamily)
MSYPEPRYLGDPGLVNATFRPATYDPDVRYRAGGTAHYLVTGATTDSHFGLYRWDMPETRGGPDPHFHRSISESFFVLAGTVGLYDGRAWIEATPGDFLYVPEGGIHAFRNADGPASMLILFAPGAPREDYFETLARVGEGMAMTDEEKTAFFLRHDTFWV